MNAFNLDVNCISKQAKIYLDYELADGVNGLVCAKNLFQRGFNSIYLTTGYDFPNTSTPPYLKGIVGKSFPTTDRG